MKQNLINPKVKATRQRFKVIFFESQHNYKSGKEYNIEVQRLSNGRLAVFKDANFHRDEPTGYFTVDDNLFDLFTNYEPKELKI